MGQSLAGSRGPAAAPRLRLRPPSPGRVRTAHCSPSLQIYPDESHYFHGERLQRHLYGAIVNFFAECFRVQDKPPTAPAREEEEEED